MDRRVSFHGRSIAVTVMGIIEAVGTRQWLLASSLYTSRTSMIIAHVMEVASIRDRVPLDLSALPPERYTVVVLRDGVEVFRRRMRIVKE
jgi:hypothetical protein